MNTKPEWVPEWVWVDYLKCAQRKHVRVALKCVTDLRCKCVWEALGRRSSGRTWVAADKSGRVLFKNFGEAEMLFTYIEQSANGVPTYESTPTMQRRSEGVKIAKHARALREALSSLPHAGHHVVSLPFLTAFDSLADNFAREERDEVKAAIIMHASDRSPLEIGAFNAMSQIERVLDAIAGAADEWARSKPPVAQLGSDNAPRLYFIREITSYFRKQYDAPLREQVAALTSVVFDCDMDAATVGKLAP